MDKNFINIDDLVRQRLGGGEEQERSGAWLNMRDLLDKEMPQKKAGFFYWRRMFSAVAVMLVVATAGIGGYYLSSPDGSAAKDSAPVAASISTQGTPRVIAMSVSGNELVNHITNMNAVASSDKASIPAHETSINGNPQHSESAAAGERNANIPTSQSGIIAANTASNHKKSVQQSATSKQLLLKLLADNGIDINKPSQADADGKQLLASNDKSISGSVSGINHKTVGAKRNNSNGVGNVVTANDNTEGGTVSAEYRTVNNHRSVNNHNMRSNHNATAANDADVAGSNMKSGVATAVRKASRKQGNGNSTGKTSADNNVFASGNSSIVATNVAQDTKNISRSGTASSVGRRSRRHATGNLPGSLGKAGAADKNNVVVKDALKPNAAAGTSVVNAAAKNNVVGAELGANSKSLAVNSTRPKTLPKGAKPQVDEAVMKEVAAANMRKSKKVIEKIVLFEHYIKTLPNEGYYKMDTISIEKITSEFGVKDNSAAGTGEVYASNMPDKKEVSSQPGKAGNPSAKGRKPGMTSGGSNAGGTSGASGIAANSNEEEPKSANSIAKKEAANAKGVTSGAIAGRSAKNGVTTEEDNAVEAEVNAPALAAASTMASVKAGLVKKETVAAKKGSGTTTVEKLSETFNDIKYKVTGVKFSPGITAGINATFFGPNSFKGFQFGFTGAFVFDDNWSMLAELKYFHRINNDKSIDDNYYSYTPAGIGQYSKQLVSNSYGFSSLQSFELPISMRYTKGNFSFFAGGNIVYSFSINTGAATMPATSPAVLVSTQGNDNAPSLKSSDFNSRIGLGYLLGLSYEVSPNVTLDFRSVQTVWDNAATPGGKMISTQLYKSPSFQVSFGYRFGGKKNKE